MEILGSAIGQAFEAFVQHGEAVQMLACFLISIVLTMALVVQSLRSSKGHSAVAQEMRSTLDKLSENLSRMTAANIDLVTVVKALELEIEKHHDIVAETLIRPKLADPNADLKISKPPKQPDVIRYDFDLPRREKRRDAEEDQPRRRFRKSADYDDDDLV